MRGSLPWFGVLGLVVLWGPLPAGAHQADQFATSPKTLGLAGAGGALPDGGGSLFTQPGTMGLNPGDLVRLSWIGGRISLAEAVGVQRIDAAGEIIPASALTAEQRLPEQALGPHSVTVDVVKRLGDFVTAGAYVTFPVPFLYYHDSVDPWAPSVVRWRHRVAQATGLVGATVRLPVRGIPGVGGVSADSALQGGLFFGFSAGVLPNANIDLDLELIGVDDGVQAPFIDVALRDVDLVVRARFRPTFSLLLDLGTITPQLLGARVGVSWRPPAQVDINPIQLDVAVEGLSNLAPIFALVDRIEAQVWLGLVDFYEPHQVRISVAKEARRWSLAADVLISDWSSLRASYGRVVPGAEDGGGGYLLLDLAGPNDFESPVVGRRLIGSEAFVDSVEVALGGEVVPVSWPTWPGRPPLEVVVRAGYRYQSPMLRPIDGPSGLLDGAVHTGSVGLGLRAPSLPLFKGPLLVDWGLQAQRLQGMDLPKSAAGLAGFEGLPVAYSEGARWPGGWAVVTGLQVGTGF